MSLFPAQDLRWWGRPRKQSIATLMNMHELIEGPSLTVLPLNGCRSISPLSLNSVTWRCSPINIDTIGEITMTRIRQHNHTRNFVELVFITWSSLSSSESEIVMAWGYSESGCPPPCFRLLYILFVTSKIDNASERAVFSKSQPYHTPKVVTFILHKSGVSSWHFKPFSLISGIRIFISAHMLDVVEMVLSTSSIPAFEHWPATGLRLAAASSKTHRSIEYL